MKIPARVLFIILLSFSLLCGYSQTGGLMAAEYFWDTDPGQGNGTPLVSVNGSFSQSFEAITQNASTLPAIGMHTLNIRAEDSTGNWGVVFTTAVQVEGTSTSLRSDEIMAAEYFWDSDPGQGNGTAMFAFNGSFSQAFEVVAQNISALPATGNHTLNVRAKNAAGNWGSVFTTVVHVEGSSTSLRTDKIIAAEYFWDTDPGQGNGSPMIALNGSFSQAFEVVEQSTSTLPATGMHTLNVRAENAAGSWGSVFSTVVQVEGTSTSLRTDKIIAAEYFWDTDPGQGNGNAMIAFNGSFSQAFEVVEQSTSALPATGIHTLNVRAENAAGSWGSVFTTVVQVEAGSTTLRTDKIIAGEYFWDTDPGQGNGNPMVAFNGSFSQAFEVIEQNAAPPSIGNHTLNIRSKDAAGNWGGIFTVVVTVGPGSTGVRTDGVIAAEYFFDTDPGQGNATPMLAQGGNFGSAYQGLLGGSIPSPVTNGMHLLSMRSKDAAGLWGQVFSVVVNIDTTIGAPNVHISGPASLCANSLTGAAYTVPSVSGNTYTWSVTGGSITSGAGTNSVVVTWNSTGPYKLLVTECAGTDCGSDSVVLTVNPVATLTVNHTICQGQAFDGFSIQGTYIDTFTAANGCDSIRTLNLTVLPVSRTTINQSICQGQSYLGYSQSGTYYDTLTAANTCDSIRTLILTVINNIQTTVTTSICQGLSYDGHGATGTFTDTFPNASNGCDSIRTLNLTVLSVSHTTVSETICQGMLYGGHSTNGTFIDTLTGANSCDSIRTLHLTVLPVNQSTITKSICAGTSYLGHNQTGTYIDTLTGSNTCDSIRTLNLTVLNPIQTNITAGVCLGQSYDGHTATGTYVDTFTAANTCDSIRTLNLTVTNGIRITIDQTVCPGHSYQGYTQTGTYIDTFTAVGGCDSIRTLNLTALLNVTSNIIRSICNGQSYGGHSTSGTFTDTLQAANGCDSIRTLLLTVLPVSQTTVNKNICSGQSYGGHNATGTFVDTLTGVNGCDSIRTLNLIVLPIVTTTIDQSICQGQSYGGHSATGTYVDTLTSVISGCDSIRTLHLTVTNSITTTINKTICTGQSFDGYSTTNTYIDSFTAVGGCDSVRTLNLTVLNNITTSVNKSICPGQSYGGHNTTGTFVDTLTSAAGCDSIRTLNLLILPTLTTSDVEALCAGQSYGGHSTTGTFIDTLTSSYGCDSIRTLHLTVNPSINDTIRQSICQGDTFNGHTATGLFTDSMIAVTGCDSVVTLNLTVNPIPAVPTITQHGDTLTASEANHYQWYRDSTLLTGQTSQSIVLNQNGNYSVEASDSSGCSNTSVVSVVINVGITEINGVGSISIYPNPAFDLLNVQCKGFTSGNSLNIKLTDALGQVVIEKTTVCTASDFTTQLQVQNLAAGVYLLQLECDKVLVTKRVVIAR